MRVAIVSRAVALFSLKIERGCVLDCAIVVTERVCFDFVAPRSLEEGRRQKKKKIWVALCDDGNVFKTQRGAVKGVIVC